MVRNSTDLRDYIRFDLNGDGDTDDIVDGQQESQPLILMNPGGFFQKYLMPTTESLSVKQRETKRLEKGYYHGIIYQIPGAEVNINGEWIAFTQADESLIKAQNPMTLQWRLSGDQLRKYGYKPGDTVNGQILVVDDQWNGLNMTKDFSIGLEESNHQPKGDVNGDGVVDVADIASIISVMAKGGNDAAADVNNDGVVDVADIATVISIMASSSRAE